MNAEPDPPTAPLPTATSGTPSRPGSPSGTGSGSGSGSGNSSAAGSGTSRAGTATLGNRPRPAPTGNPELSEAPTGAIPIQQGPQSRRAQPTAASTDPTAAGPAPPGTAPARTAPARTDASGTAPAGTDASGASATRGGAPAAESGARVLLVPVLAGAAVAVALGVYGRLHGPTGFAVSVAGFSGLGYVKAWLATATVLFGLLQLGSAMVMHGRVLVRPPTWIGGLHRWSGRIAVLVSVPVAVQCLYALGFQSGSTRVWVHSILGCLFYGAFTAKMLSLDRPGAPRWAMPLLGGLVFAGLIGLWLTSALWLFSGRGVHL
jgi:Family of unknown function (DUF6529)